MQINLDELIPPESMNFVGAGDFKLIGEGFLRHFIQIGALKPCDRVLDVGCGIGRMAIPLTAFLDQVGSYEGFDIVPLGINWCKEKITPHFPRFHFQLADVYSQFYNPTGKYKACEYQFPYENESFDFVFLTSVFTHMLPADLENYLAEVARVLKPTGRCLITFFLLNPESIDLMAAGKAMLDFPYTLGTHRVVDLAMPEKTVGYDERFILELYQRYGLFVRLPLYYGNWCSRESYLSGQDIIVASKASSPGTETSL